MEQLERGSKRESELEKDVYFSDHYFSMPQLCSFAHQLNYVHSMQPKSAIEIGLGNGFVSTFLNKSGVPTLTADINSNLEPDICAPLCEVKNFIEEPRDVVICCEVLEHMPLDDLEGNLDHLRNLGNRLFLTLPNSFKSWGIGGLGFIPKIGGRLFDFNFNVPLKRPIADGPHFWEVGYNSQCSQRAIIRSLRGRYSSVRSGRFSLNPYHIWFICE